MRYWMVLIVVLVSLPACVEEIEFAVEREGGQLVIDGRLTDASEDQIIRLSRAASTARIPIKVSNAQVTVVDETGDRFFYRESADEPGTYVLPKDNIAAVPGRLYHLEVILNDGGVYESEPEPMPVSPGTLDSVYYDFTQEKVVNNAGIITERYFINAYGDINLENAPATPYFLRWDVEEVYLLSPTDFPDPFGYIPPPCYVYVYTSGTDLNLYDGRDKRPTKLNRLPLGRQEIDKAFVEKHIFSIYQRTLNQKAFEYARKMDQLLSNVGNIFDTPPAPIPGNIRNVNDPREEVLGYFEVISTQVKRFRTFRFDVPLKLQPECLYSTFKPNSDDYLPYCLNCLSVRNSTYKRPDYFD